MDFQKPFFPVEEFSRCASELGAPDGTLKLSLYVEESGSLGSALNAGSGFKTVTGKVTAIW